MINFNKRLCNGEKKLWYNSIIGKGDESSFPPYLNINGKDYDIKNHGLFFIGGEKMNKRQERFCREYKKLGNASKAAVNAGYSEKTAYSQGQRLLKNVEVQKYLKQLEEPLRNADIATMDEINRFWSDVMRNTEIDVKDRLKASELRARVQGAFVDRVQIADEVNITVELEE